MLVQIEPQQLPSTIVSYLPNDCKSICVFCFAYRDFRRLGLTVSKFLWFTQISSRLGISG